MIFLAIFDANVNIKHHVSYMMNNIELVALDVGTHDDLIQDYNIDEDKFDEFGETLDYNRIRQIMQQYDISTKRLIDRAGLGSIKGGSAVFIVSYVSVSQYKNIMLTDIKNLMKKYPKDSKEYTEIVKLHGKIKMFDTPEQIEQAFKQFLVRVNQDNVTRIIFNDFEDYLQYIFDNQ